MSEENIRLIELVSELSRQQRKMARSAKKIAEIIDQIEHELDKDDIQEPALELDIMPIGISRTTRDKTKVVYDTLLDLGKVVDPTTGERFAVTEEILLNALEKDGIDRAKAKEIISRLRAAGQIIMNRGVFRPVRDY